MLHECDVPEAVVGGAIESYAVPGVVLYLQVAASFVAIESVVLLVVINPIGWPLESTGGVVSVAPLILYVALAMLLAVIPVFHAPAFIVVVEETVIGAEYIADASVGVMPSSVYRIMVPIVDVETVTNCADEYVPVAGENVGVATTGKDTVNEIA